MKLLVKLTQSLPTDAKPAWDRIRIWNMETKRFVLLAEVNHPLFAYFDDLLGQKRWSNLYYNAKRGLVAKQWNLDKDAWYDLWVKVRAALKAAGESGDSVMDAAVCLQS